jgi:hypothetical protein
MGILITLIITVLWWWRATAREHYRAVNFTMMLFLRPDAYQVQRDNFLRLVKRQKASTPHQLAVALFSSVTSHSATVMDKEMLGHNEMILWEVNHGTDLPA